MLTVIPIRNAAPFSRRLSFTVGPQPDAAPSHSGDATDGDVLEWPGVLAWPAQRYASPTHSNACSCHLITGKLNESGPLHSTGMACWRGLVKQIVTATHPHASACHCITDNVIVRCPFQPSISAAAQPAHAPDAALRPQDRGFLSVSCGWNVVVILDAAQVMGKPLGRFLASSQAHHRSC